MATKEEKEDRKRRRKDREKRKKKGTYETTKQKKKREKQEVLEGASRTERPSDEEIEDIIRHQRKGDPKRIKRSTGVEPKFIVGEPCLVKAVVTGHIYPDGSQARYQISLMETPQDIKAISSGKLMTNGFNVSERYLARWPRSK